MTGHSHDIVKRPGTRSFTLLETVLAIAVLAIVIMEVASTQGNIVSFSTYSRRVNEAMLLARGVMAQVEFEWSYREFKELDVVERERKFADLDDDSDYRYNLEIKEWKLPIFDLLAGGGPSGGEQEESEEGQGGGGLASMLKDVIGDEVLKTAHVEVSWPVGAKRDSVTLTMLLTNQRKIDELILSQEGVWKKFLASLKPKPKKGERPTTGDRRGSTTTTNPESISSPESSGDIDGDGT